MATNYEPPKYYELKDISPENVIASLKPHALHSSTVQNNKNYHHNMGFPCTDKEKGIFNMVFPQMITSSINETTSEDGNSKGYPIFAKVYGNYDQMVTVVKKQIEEIFSSSQVDMSDFGVEEYRKFFMESMVKKGKSLDYLEKEYQENILDLSCVFNQHLFQHLALKILIEDEKKKDIRGVNLENAMISLKKCYCDSMDDADHADLKKSILLGIGVPMKDIKQPTSHFITDIIRYQKYDEKHPTLAGLIDYTKCPQIQFKLMVSIPKPDAEKKKDQIILSTAGQVLWTSIYDYQRNPLGKTPIKTYAQFDRFLYRAGDTKLGKKMFEILQSMTTSAPTVYWEKGGGIIQFKVTVLKIFDIYELAGFSKALSNEETQRDLQDAREAMAYYNREKIEQPQIQHDLLALDYTDTNSDGQGKRDRDPNDQDFQQTVNDMIDEGYDHQESFLKKKRS